MHNIERRIAALEATNMPADEMTIIIRRFVSPGALMVRFTACGMPMTICGRDYQARLSRN